MGIRHSYIYKKTMLKFIKGTQNITTFNYLLKINITLANEVIKYRCTKLIDIELNTQCI